MKHYDSIPRFQDDGTLKGEIVWGFNKLDGQNFCVKYNSKTKQFGPFGSRNRTVDENDEQFGEVVKWFKDSDYETELTRAVDLNRGKRGVFNGVDEITFFFEWYGQNSFAGKHHEGDIMRLALIDVFMKKRGYMEPKDFCDIFGKTAIELPELFYIGTLDNEIIERVKNNDWGEENPSFSKYVKEGIVFKRSTLLPGQRRPSVKVKTKWWLNKLHSMYSEEECKKLE